MADTTNLIIVAGLLAGGAFLFMNRCQYLGMCDDGPMAPAPAAAEPAPEAVPVADVGEDQQDPRTTIINNQYYPMQPQAPIVVRDRRYVPIPVPPYPNPRPKPQPIHIEEKCCKCKTTGYDNAVVCSHDGGRTWSTHSAYKYDINKSMKECVKKCPKDRRSLPWPWGGIDIDIDIGGHRSCSDPYCKQYPSRCSHCPPSCATTISKHGRTYKLTALTRLPDVMTMQFPPNYVQIGKCIYQIVAPPTTTSQLAVSFLGVSL